MIRRVLRSSPFWAFIGSILAASITAWGAIAAARTVIQLQLAVEETPYPRAVFANKFPFESTQISILKGDDVEIIVLGKDASWACSTDGKTNQQRIVSPLGELGNRYSKHFLQDANECELIGYFRDNAPFRIGAYERFTAQEAGILYLGANDSVGCDWNCYSDNNGTLSVLVTVRREKSYK